MLDPKVQEALDSLKTFEIKPLTTDQLSGLTTVDLSNLGTTPSAVGAVGQGYTYTYTGTGTGAGLSGGSINWQSPNTVWSTTSIPVGKPGTVELRGKDADLVINGKSLMQVLERIEDRLNLLEPNTELEKDWDDLRKLGERYRKLEKKCKEKAETWKKLKAMPPPAVD